MPPGNGVDTHNRSQRAAPAAAASASRTHHVRDDSAHKYDAVLEQVVHEIGGAVATLNDRRNNGHNRGDGKGATASPLSTSTVRQRPCWRRDVQLSTAPCG